MNSVVFSIVFLLDLFLIAAGSSGAVPFGEFLYVIRFEERTLRFVTLLQEHWHSLLCCGSAFQHLYQQSGLTSVPNMAYVLAWDHHTEAVAFLTSLNLGYYKSCSREPHSSTNSTSSQIPSTMGEPYLSPRFPLNSPWDRPPHS